MKGGFYILLMVLGTAAGQLLIKSASRTLNACSGRRVVFVAYMASAYLVIATVPFFVNLAMDHFQLSVVFAFSGLHYLTVPIAAHFILGEQLSGNMIVGMLLIMLGVIVHNLYM